MYVGSAMGKCSKLKNSVNATITNRPVRALQQYGLRGMPSEEVIFIIRRRRESICVVVRSTLALLFFDASAWLPTRAVALLADMENPISISRLRNHRKTLPHVLPVRMRALYCKGTWLGESVVSVTEKVKHFRKILFP